MTIWMPRALDELFLDMLRLRNPDVDEDDERVLGRQMQRLLLECVKSRLPQPHELNGHWYPTGTTAQANGFVRRQIKTGPFVHNRIGRVVAEGKESGGSASKNTVAVVCIQRIGFDEAIAQNWDHHLAATKCTRDNPPPRTPFGSNLSVIRALSNDDLSRLERSSTEYDVIISDAAKWAASNPSGVFVAPPKQVVEYMNHLERRG